MVIQSTDTNALADRTMKFGMITEGAVPPGITHHRRYKQLIDEAVYAEEMGFSFWGCSEQHGLRDLGIGATEVLLAAVARETSRIEMRHMVRLLLKGMNHPLRIAEQAATLDIVSDGRCGLGTGRANLPDQLETFQIKSEDTRPMWEESMQLIVKAFTEESVTHNGKFWQINEPFHLTPRPLQYPHPPLSVAATSVPTLERAGAMGIGAMTQDHYIGWDVAEKNAMAYLDNIGDPSDPISSVVNRSLAWLALPAVCTDTEEEALAFWKSEGLYYPKAFLKAFPRAVSREKNSNTYEYFNDVKKYEDHLGDIEYFRENTPGMLIGTPDLFIDKIRRLQDLGYNEVILRVDARTLNGDQLMRSLRLIGEHVIPEFTNPSCVVRGTSLRGLAP